MVVVSSPHGHDVDFAKTSVQRGQNVSGAETEEVGGVDVATQEDLASNDLGVIQNARRVELERGFGPVQQVETEQILAPRPPVSPRELVLEVDDVRVLKKRSGVLVVVHKPKSWR